MKKNILKLLVTFVMISFVLLLNITLSVDKDGMFNPNLKSFNQIAQADVEIPINWGQYYCVCKDNLCQDGHWVSFRERCGNTPSENPVICPDFTAECQY